jgi:hypothetical protein
VLKVNAPASAALISGLPRVLSRAAAPFFPNEVKTFEKVGAAKGLPATTLHDTITQRPTHFPFLPFALVQETRQRRGRP